LTFERPLLLWALAGVPLLAALALWERRNVRAAAREWSQVAFVLDSSRLPTHRFALAKFLLLAGGFAAATVGFAAPVIRETTAEPLWENVYVGLLIDVSRSTEAPLEPHAVDSPTRWEEMQRGLLEFLRQSPPGLEISALAFTDLAIPLMASPTDDHLEIAAKVRRLDHRFITRQGTNLGEALRAGRALFKEEADRKDGKTFSLVMISDGDTPITLDLDAELARVPYPVYTIGVGSTEPVYIPDPGSLSGYVEKAGEPVQTALREDTLTHIATRTGGHYYPFRKRGELLHLLGRIVEQAGRRTTRQVIRDRRVATEFFVGAFVMLALHQRSPLLWRRRARAAPRGVTPVGRTA